MGERAKKCRMRRILPQRYYFISGLPTFCKVHFHRLGLDLYTPLLDLAFFLDNNA